MNIVIFGAPGAGKGTQSALLMENYDMRHLSTGDIFRKHIKDQTALGKTAKGYMDAGNLVPDEIVIGMVDEVLSTLNGQSFILDGFPRTVPQAEALEKLINSKDLKIDKVISLKVSEEDLVNRLAGRRVCVGCGAVYHVQAKPTKQFGVCDVCGKEVVQRKDDSEEVVLNRLNVYEKNTQPVKDYYETSGRLVEVDGNGEASEVFERIQKHLKK